MLCLEDRIASFVSLSLSPLQLQSAGVWPRLRGCTARMRLSRLVQLGTAVGVSFPSKALGVCVDSSPLLAHKDSGLLKDRLKCDGYLYLKGVLPRCDVVGARSTILAHLRAKGVVEEHSEDAIVPGAVLPNLEGRNELTHQPSVLKVLESGAIQSVMLKLFNKPASTLDFKWLRAVPPSVFTGAHCDYVYMSKGSPSLTTVWIPFADVSPEMGTLCVLRGRCDMPAFTILSFVWTVCTCPPVLF